jgi:8-oxo-dGTP diphosphatase
VSGKARQGSWQPDSGHVSSRGLGVGVIVPRGEKVLFGLRRGRHGGGTWSVPGGDLKAGESPEVGARRELREETGLESLDARIVAETDDVFASGLRYRTFFVRVERVSGEPIVREPEACERWAWFSWDDPPQPLFLPVANLRAARFRP